MARYDYDSIDWDTVPLPDHEGPPVPAAIGAAREQLARARHHLDMAAAALLAGNPVHARSHYGDALVAFGAGRLAVEIVLMGEVSDAR